MKTLLLGMGNPILSDDSVGIRLATDVAGRLEGTPGLDVVAECSAGGLELLDVLESYERLIVLDSIRTSGGAPGDWYMLTAGSLKETIHLSNVHDVNFATALEFGRRMGMPLPPDEEIRIFAVEVENNNTFGEALSARLAAAYPRILDEIYAGVLRSVEAAADATPRTPSTGTEGTRNSGSGT